MDIARIKQRLENTYHIGFNVTGGDNCFKVTPSDSKYDMFEIVGQVKNDVRLNIVARPETFAVPFVELLNKSDAQKRKMFVSLWKSIDIGELSLFLNEVEVSADDFLNNKSDWRRFELKYTLIPFNDADVATKICNIICGMYLSLIDYCVIGFEEGNKISVHADSYERNPANRDICLSAKGYTCAICGFNFETFYGDAGKDTIEVHHTVPVSEMGEHYIVKPLEELIPVCSNCHTIIHKRKIPYSINEVKAMIATQKETTDTSK